MVERDIISIEPDQSKLRDAIDISESMNILPEDHIPLEPCGGGWLLENYCSAFFLPLVLNLKI